MSNGTLLVTGATGHVGLAVLRLARERGLAVLASSRGAGPPADAPDDGIEWTTCDIADAGAVRDLGASRSIDACIHCAAVSNEAYARPEPLAAIAANIGATANLLEAARVHGWRRFVLVSTGSVFQCRADTTSPVLEDEPVAPRNVYSTTKVGAETLARMYRTEYGVSAATVRISWVYGPPVVADDPTRGPIPSYLLRSLRGEPIAETGGEFAASFTYVDDVAAGLMALAAAPGLDHDVYHLGPGRNFSVAEVAAAVRAAVSGADIRPGHGTEPWTRFTALRGPLAGTRLADATGFEPAHTLDEGIAAYARWMRAHPERWS